MSTKIQKWGNGLAVRLPKEAARKLGFVEGTSVELVPEKHGMRIIRQRRKGHALTQLVQGITSKNVHHEVLWGDAGGNEVW